MKRYDYILFDLDGTLTESAEGVKVSLAHAMDVLELSCPDLSDFTKYVGPPLQDTFRGICAVPEERIPEAMRIYRDYYDKVGILHNRYYDGTSELLASLRGAGCKIAVCTSKNEPVAERVSDLLGLRSYIDAVCGSTLDGSRKNKADLIPYALRTLDCTEKERAVMIGDTHFDAEGAILAGVDYIGVTYGYGTREGMETVGATVFADSPAQLQSILIHES